MAAPRTRRDFLADVGRGMLVASVGCGLAAELGLAPALADEVPDTLNFGELESLVRLMQETPVDRLQPVLIDQLKAGVELRRLVAAGALANARTFGGEDYVGFHTMMALAPAFHMSEQLPQALQPLPIFKVLYRNTNRIQERGGRKAEVLAPVKTADLQPGSVTSESLREAVRRHDVAGAEGIFATLKSPQQMLDDLLLTVQDNTEVHRVVLPYRAWDMLDLIGKQHAQTLLRQSVRYCLKSNSGGAEAQRVLPQLLDEHHLLGRAAGNRRAEDKFVDELAMTIFGSTPQQAAAAAAAALADGVAPTDVGEAIALATNQLLLRDGGRTAADEVPGKPIGSVHGDSIGVHACDSANAWRNLARVSEGRNIYACLILGAYQAALDRVNRGGDFLNWKPLPLAMHLARTETSDPEGLLRELDIAVRGNLQARACAVVHHYGQLGHDAKPVFDALLRFGVSEDGSLHAEKFYRTVCEEFASTRPAFRWRHLTALARVTASEFGRPAAGQAEARQLLKV